MKYLVGIKQKNIWTKGLKNFWKIFGELLVMYLQTNCESYLNKYSTIFVPHPSQVYLQKIWWLLNLRSIRFWTDLGLTNQMANFSLAMQSLFSSVAEIKTLWRAERYAYSSYLLHYWEISTKNQWTTWFFMQTRTQTTVHAIANKQNFPNPTPWRSLLWIKSKKYRPTCLRYHL